ncbi:uncharacterized protein PV09_08253 [Verruconis gallopava]|uniref:Autophagy-related protein 16 domain-containing protein n=1 Tax=Verruconis gallopava TaxID=253628 RepID=A0A0D2A0M7_9PEZI|nr:uncharacterized protein PV09_08253 [Verruconis gallopava]KIW00213.1 hypothetical protein PV09_08253 [Verruconis gallopava]
MDALSQFLANIDSTQRRDHADREFIVKYQKLADAKAAADARARAAEKVSAAGLLPPPPQEDVEKPPDRTATPVGAFFYRSPSSPKSPSVTSPPASEPAATLTLRQQLADAQRARTSLEKANAQIPNLLATQNAQTRQIQLAEKEIASLRRKLRDREDEIREKQKLASDVQDEMISLGLQLSVAEQKAEKLEGENRALVERWMKEMGGRAEKMNRDMGFDEDGKRT